MKFPRTKVIENEGLLHVQAIVNKQGSIFRLNHQESDIGLDGIIEFIIDGKSTGHLVTVQIKSGDSYFNAPASQFRIQTDKAHIDYWTNFSIPVILIAYSPSLRSAAWISISSLVEDAKYNPTKVSNTIIIPITKLFNSVTLNREIYRFIEAKSQESQLLTFADKCLTHDALEKRDAFYVLSHHYMSRGKKITSLIARQLIMDNDIEIAKDALFTLGYSVARSRWSFNPNSVREGEESKYASILCSNLNEAEVERIIRLVDEEHFGGPAALGERCFDVICCLSNPLCVPSRLFADDANSIQTRANCLYMIFECKDEYVEEAFNSGDYQHKDRFVYNTLFKMIGLI